MIVEFNHGAQPQHVAAVRSQLTRSGLSVTEVRTQRAHYLVGVGDERVELTTANGDLGVKNVFYVSDAYQLVSRRWRHERSAIDLGDGVRIHAAELALIIGPCAVENEQQIVAIINHLKAANVRIMRGGVFKPRSSPYAFRGLGLEGLELFSRLAREAGIKVVSEVMENAQIEPMYEYVDVFQVGARNTQNFSLLHELGKIDKPVLLKRGISGTIEELLQSAEYVFASGNENVILCERGIRTFETAYRNTLDLNAVPMLKEKSHLPVLVDPSHGIGVRDLVEPMSLAAVMAGADGLIVEVHPTPDLAFSDGQQSLNFEQSAQLIRRVREAFNLRCSPNF